jgi:hypothetical protein
MDHSYRWTEPRFSFASNLSRNSQISVEAATANATSTSEKAQTSNTPVPTIVCNSQLPSRGDTSLRELLEELLQRERTLPQSAESYFDHEASGVKLKPLGYEGDHAKCQHQLEPYKHSGELYTAIEWATEEVIRNKDLGKIVSIGELCGQMPQLQRAKDEGKVCANCADRWIEYQLEIELNTPPVISVEPG